METKIRAEWDSLKTVVIHQPGIEMFFGLLEPFASLYERAFSRYGAREEHKQLEYILRHELNVNVLKMKDIILNAADVNPTIRQQLVDLAHATIDIKGSESDIALARNELNKNEPLLDVDHFFKTLLLNPLIQLKTGKGTRAIHLNITERQPLSNLYFMRDQQAVTDKGIFLSRMSKPQRRSEPKITRFLWEIIAANVVHETQAPGTFEGGDFIPMKDFALVGLGDRSNQAGVEQMLRYGLNFDEVGVVHQPNHPLIPSKKPDPMVDMHLDTYFNVASSSVVIGLDLLLRQAIVEIYHRKGPGEYEKEKTTTNLHDYVKDKGLDLISITTLEQLAYASNFLCIRDGTILAIEVERDVKAVLENLQTKAKSEPQRYEKLLAQAEKDYKTLKNQSEFFPHKRGIYQHGIDIYPIVLPNLTGGYGGAHCMTCALRRG
ncbi:MAG: arginine deiminase family protein [Promethearchaeota archaeon]